MNKDWKQSDNIGNQIRRKLEEDIKLKPPESCPSNYSMLSEDADAEDQSKVKIVNGHWFQETAEFNKKKAEAM